MAYQERDRDAHDPDRRGDPVPGEDDMRDDLELRRQTDLDETPATTGDEDQAHEGGEPVGNATPDERQMNP